MCRMFLVLLVVVVVLVVGVVLVGYLLLVCGCVSLIDMFIYSVGLDLFGIFVFVVMIEVGFNCIMCGCLVDLVFIDFFYYCCWLLLVDCFVCRVFVDEFFLFMCGLDVIYYIVQGCISYVSVCCLIWLQQLLYLFFFRFMLGWW